MGSLSRIAYTLKLNAKYKTPTMENENEKQATANQNSSEQESANKTQNDELEPTDIQSQPATEATSNVGQGPAVEDL